MLKIKATNARHVGENYDYELSDGTLLHVSEWNGEAYTVKADGREITYRPVYRYQAEQIDLGSIEENSPEWDAAVEIIGFNN
jgi:hypothetical protein